jgi:hypothetical protein
MGNFSRNTFDPAKRYTAVRLQQGVPLVDADWNELQDVTRNEVYDALSIALPNALTPTMILQSIGTNDIQLTPGVAIVGGRPLRLSTILRYSTQRYANAATAAADGVQPVPPLTTPTIARTDTVFLDVFEREVRSTEDPALVNSAIGVETAVRLRREIVLRVAEGATTPPAPPAGHTFLAVTLMNRPANVATISPSSFDDIAPRPEQHLPIEASFPPIFTQPATLGTLMFGPWLTNFSSPTVQALKVANASAFGITPVYFPDGARIRSLRYRGSTNGSVPITVQLLRIRLDNGLFDVVAQDTVATPGNFDRTIVVPTPAGLHVVDNDAFSYVAAATTTTSPDIVNLRGIAVRYVV